MSVINQVLYVNRLEQDSGLIGHRVQKRSATIWLTGCNSAGRSIIGNCLENELRLQGYPVKLLDETEVLQDLVGELGLTEIDRNENLRRISFIADLLTQNGVFVIISAASPSHVVRDETRQRLGKVIEVCISTPMNDCEHRDDELYEPPRHPDVECRTDRESVAESADKVLAN